MKRTAVLVALLALNTCGTPEVDWSTYAPQVRDRVEGAIASRDCDTLAQEFDYATDGSDAHRAKYGEGNGDLMRYINGHMDELGC